METRGARYTEANITDSLSSTAKSLHSSKTNLNSNKNMSILQTNLNSDLIRNPIAQQSYSQPTNPNTISAQGMYSYPYSEKSQSVNSSAMLQNQLGSSTPFSNSSYIQPKHSSAPQSMPLFNDQYQLNQKLWGNQISQQQNPAYYGSEPAGVNSSVNTAPGQMTHSSTVEQEQIPNYVASNLSYQYTPLANNNLVPIQQMQTTGSSAQSRLVTPGKSNDTFLNGSAQASETNYSISSSYPSANEVSRVGSNPSYQYYQENLVQQQQQPHYSQSLSSPSQYKASNVTQPSTIQDSQKRSLLHTTSLPEIRTTAISVESRSEQYVPSYMTGSERNTQAGIHQEQTQHQQALQSSILGQQSNIIPPGSNYMTPVNYALNSSIGGMPQQHQLIPSMIPYSSNPAAVAMGLGMSSGVNGIQMQLDMDKSKRKIKAQSLIRRTCPVCFKTFNRPSGLRIHMNTHTGEKPYQCKWKGCERVFSVRSNMKRHYKLHLKASAKHGNLHQNINDEDDDAEIHEEHDHSSHIHQETHNHSEAR
ncbi:nucleic acid binding protein [[Candida] boidinii]|nr:nucleic acid binding protein [[Candida] boidinii]